MSLQSSLGIAAAVGGGLFLAYCVYFDHKRRSDPLFKQKLKARKSGIHLLAVVLMRLCAGTGRAQAKKDAESSRATRGLPDMSDLEAVQKFFVQELQFGEELLAMGKLCCLSCRRLTGGQTTGEIESGVEHLSNAIAVCGQPQQLLQILQQTLPVPVFQLILARLPVVSQQLNEREPTIRSVSQELVDDDVE